MSRTFWIFAYLIWLFFKKTITAISRQPRGRKSEFLNRIGIGAKFSGPKDPLNVQVTKIKCVDAEETCNINISLTSPGECIFFLLDFTALWVSLILFEKDTVLVIVLISMPLVGLVAIKWLLVYIFFNALLKQLMSNSVYTNLGSLKNKHFPLELFKRLARVWGWNC